MRAGPILLYFFAPFALLAVYLAGKKFLQGERLFNEIKSCRDQVKATQQAITKLELACEKCASERARCAYSERPPSSADVEQTKYADPRKAIPFYRAFSNNFNDHLYTTNDGWVEEHVREFDHIRQGIAAYIFPTQEPNTEPLYQLYRPSWHDHFYTTSIAEREDFIRWGYHNEGIAGYVFWSGANGGKPLYRLWSDGRKDHLYTVSERERGQAMGRGYACEGIVGYAYPASPL